MFGYKELKNAEKEFSLNNKEKDIILKHMWPVTLPFPRYIESFIITLTDKYCASKEIFDYYNRKKFTVQFLSYQFSNTLLTVKYSFLLGGGVI